MLAPSNPLKILILGGNRFFSRHLDEILLGEGHEITLLNRGTLDDGLGERIQRLEADRKVRTALEAAVQGRTWDLVL